MCTIICVDDDAAILKDTYVVYPPLFDVRASIIRMTSSPTTNYIENDEKHIQAYTTKLQTDCFINYIYTTYKCLH